MKQKLLLPLLGIEAIICVLLSLAQTSLSGAFSSLMAFPFEQIGIWLRALSLSSSAGNAIAFLIYLAVCLSPAAVMLILKKKRKLYAEDGLLFLLSVALFVVLYYMINPGLISSYMGGTFGKALYGITVYSVFVSHFVLRVLRLLSVGGTDNLIRYMKIMLKIIAALFVYLAFGSGFNSLLTSISELQAGNSRNENLLGASYFFLTLQYAVNALPNILNVLVIFSGIKLLDSFQKDRYSEESEKAACRVSHLCVKALSITVLSSVSFNLLQLLFIKTLRVINSTLEIPVLSIAFVLSALLLTRFVAENKQLKDDNDMFI